MRPAEQDGVPAEGQRAKGKVYALRSLSEASRVTRSIGAIMFRHGYSNWDIFAVRLALEEAIENAILHGHGGDLSKVVRISSWVSVDEVLLEVRDEGPGFNQTVASESAAPSYDRPGGRGLYLIHHFMTWVRYEGVSNCVKLCRRRSFK